MADVAVIPQVMSRLTTFTPSYGAGILNTTDRFLVQNDGKTFLHFKKAGAADCVVTIETPGTVDGLAIPDRTFTVVANTGDVMIPPMPPQVYNQPGTQSIAFTLSNVAGLTLAAIRFAD